MKRAIVNLTTDQLDDIRRLADAQRELGEIARDLLNARTSTREQRQDFGRRINAVRASLHTIELRSGIEQ